MMFLEPGPKPELLLLDRESLRVSRFRCTLVAVNQRWDEGFPRRELFAVMDAFEQVTRDMREFAIEVKRLGYALPAGYENRFLELSERMIKRTDDLAEANH